MKNLITSVLFALSLFIFTPSVYAADLTVNCNTTVCQLSTHDPIFPPNVVWPPSEEQERSVLIKNTDTNSKEILLQAKRSSATGQIDEHVSLVLALENSQIWQGTLANLLTDEKISLGQFTSNQEKTLSVKAKISNDIPNSLQGTSSDFDFGFGFDGSQNEGSTDPGSNPGSNPSPQNSNSSTSSNSNPNQNTQNTSDASVLASLTGPLSAFLSFLAPDTDAQTDVLGSQTGKRKGQVLGDNTVDTGGASCSTSPYWPLILLAQFIVILVLMRFRNGRLYDLLSLTVSALSAAGIFYLVCQKWYTVLAAVPPALYFLYLAWKRHKETI